MKDEDFKKELMRRKEIVKKKKPPIVNGSWDRVASAFMDT